jgi:non-heme chloroperoxidase
MQAVSRIVTSSDGCRLYAEAAGNRDNPAILFIHGIGVSSAWWRRQFDHLSDLFYCVCFDLRGHGASEKPSDAAAYRDSKRWADDVAAIIDAFELSKPLVCAWSYRGDVLCNYLRHYGQENLSGLVLIDTGLLLDKNPGGQLLQEGCWEPINKLFSPDVTTYRQGVEASYRLLTSSPVEQRDEADFLGVSFLVAPSTWQAILSREVDHTGVFQSVSLPALILYGRQDKICTPFASEQLLRVIPRAEVSYYSCGHAPFYEEAERFNVELAQFQNALLSK